jgi:hypothetical protein
MKKDLLRKLLYKEYFHIMFYKDSLSYRESCDKNSDIPTNYNVLLAYKTGSELGLSKLDVYNMTKAWKKAMIELCNANAAQFNDGTLVLLAKTVFDGLVHDGLIESYGNILVDDNWVNVTAWKVAFRFERMRLPRHLMEPGFASVISVTES